MTGTFKGLARFGPLGPAEAILVAGSDSGDFDRIGAGGLPQPGDETRRVRAELIRFLLIGGPDAPPMHEKGLRLGGAWITGVLDFEGCRIPRDIGLLDCRFEATPVLRSGVVDTLSLDGSDLPGFIADRLEARGDLLFRSATITGPVILRGARIGGDLVLDGATLHHPGDRAFSAERISVRGSALLRGTSLRGGLAIPGARIGGDLDLVGATIDRPDADAIEAESAAVTGDVALRRATITGALSLVSARIGGDLDLSGAIVSYPGDRAVNLNRTVVDGAFFLREAARIDGALSLNGASLGAMVDDPACWPAPGDLLLNRCLYGAILGAPVDSHTRLDWLSRQSPARWHEDFWPQPYEQLARVLTEMGHDEDARRVLMEKERLARAARRARAASPVTRAVLRAQDTLVGLTTGYGRQPLLALAWLGLFWVMGAVVYSFLWQQDAIRPNVMVVLRSPEWVLCGVPQGETLFLPSVGQTREGLAAPGQAQLRCFLSRPEAAAFPKHNSLMMSMDALLPGVDTGQRNYWSPDTRGTLGLAGIWFLYFQTIAGWALSLLAVAGFSGIVKSK